MTVTFHLREMNPISPNFLPLSCLSKRHAVVKCANLQSPDGRTAFRRKALLGLLFLSCFLVHPFVTKADDIKIVKISPAGGFTFDAISSICEDKFGFIWFGSNSGVYRYNSIETVKFINLPEDKSSLPGNTVRSLYLDMKKALWIATNNGACIFDHQCECF